MNEHEPKENATNNNKAVIKKISIHTHAILRFSIAKPKKNNLTYDFGISTGDSNVANVAFFVIAHFRCNTSISLVNLFSHTFLFKRNLYSSSERRISNTHSWLNSTKVATDQLNLHTWTARHIRMSLTDMCGRARIMLRIKSVTKWSTKRLTKVAQNNVNVVWFSFFLAFRLCLFCWFNSFNQTLTLFSTIFQFFVDFFFIWLEMSIGHLSAWVCACIFALISISRAPREETSSNVASEVIIVISTDETIL